MMLPASFSLSVSIQAGLRAEQVQQSTLCGASEVGVGLGGVGEEASSVASG